MPPTPCRGHTVEADDGAFRGLPVRSATPPEERRSLRWTVRAEHGQRGRAPDSPPHRVQGGSSANEDELRTLSAQMGALRAPVDDVSGVGGDGAEGRFGPPCAHGRTEACTHEHSDKASSSRPRDSDAWG